MFSKSKVIIELNLKVQFIIWVGFQFGYELFLTFLDCHWLWVKRIIGLINLMKYISICSWFSLGFIIGLKLNTNWILHCIVWSRYICVFFIISRHQRKNYCCCSSTWFSNDSVYIPIWIQFKLLFVFQINFLIFVRLVLYLKVLYFRSITYNRDRFENNQIYANISIYLISIGWFINW